MYHYPHAYSYKARTVADVIILCRMDWEYLMEYFPASKEEIERRAEDNRILKPASIADREKTTSFYTQTHYKSRGSLIPTEYVVF